MTQLPSMHMTAQEWVDTIGWQLPPDDCADYLRFVWGRNDSLRKAGLPPLKGELDDRKLQQLLARADRLRNRRTA